MNTQIQKIIENEPTLKICEFSESVKITGKMTKQIKKYVAFYPASSNSNEYWTTDSIKEMTRMFRYDVMISGSMKKVANGVYNFENIEIYNTIIHTEVKKEFEN